MEIAGGDLLETNDSKQRANGTRVRRKGELSLVSVVAFSGGVGVIHEKGRRRSRRMTKEGIGG